MVRSREFLEFNLGILFISTSAVLGRYITASSSLVTLLRCLIGATCLFALCKLLKISLSFDWKNHGRVIIWTSLLMAIHWATYFYSLDYSNVSVGLMTLYTFPAFTAVIEPIWHRRRIPIKNLALAMMALLAVYIIAPPFEIESDMSIAVLLGLFSSLCYSIRNIWITSISTSYHGTTFMAYQLSGMVLFLLPSLFFVDRQVVDNEWSAILMLGVVTTAAGHTLFLRGLTHFKATTASLFAIIVPVYFLHEVPSKRTFIGGTIIIAIVIIKALDKKES